MKTEGVWDNRIRDLYFVTLSRCIIIREGILSRKAMIHLEQHKKDQKNLYKFLLLCLLLPFALYRNEIIQLKL